MFILLGHSLYIDPTSGGTLLQLLLGGSAIAVVFRLARHRVAAWWKKLKQLRSPR